MAGKEEKKSGSQNFKNEPGNQTPDTPNKKESERGGANASTIAAANARVPSDSR